MSRVPPNLLYLTIYNPSLHPSGPISGDDEDAEEQAHILFYTAKERAVSRDRILRQVGLAKALVNFSEMFNAEEACSNVHSQSRRMVMVSPEPDFWIHAGVDVAKTPRAPIDKGKAKSKEKEISMPEKAKENEQPIVYDYHDASVHDVALRADILRGYEQFKLTHGSFTSILSTLGQQALELQLERFFTVWAWSWNLEDGHEFGEHLGVPLHPLYRSLVPLLDKFSFQIHDEIAPIIISPPSVIPSTRFREACYPSSLPWHLLSLVPPPSESMLSDQIPDSYLTAEDTPKAKRTSASNNPGPRTEAAKGDGAPIPGQHNFLGMPAMNINMNMNLDMRKWNWPGYLTFGKGSGKRSAELPIDEEGKTQISEDQPKPEREQPLHLQIDRNALEDAISSDNNSLSAPLDLDNLPFDTTGQQDTLSQSEMTIVPSDSDNHGVSDPRSHEPVSVADNTQSPESPILLLENRTPSNMRAPADSDAASLAPSMCSLTTVQSQAHYTPQFSSTTVYLADSHGSLATRRRKVFYIAKYPVVVALVGLDGNGENLNPDASDLYSIVEKVMGLLGDIGDVMVDDALKSASDILPSATKILQPKDRHVVSATCFTLSSTGFTSNSEHLYNAQQLQENDPEISEVFSRGQNPQHWHVAKRGLGLNDEGAIVNGEVYMEVFRKETSLTDVDNVLAGVVRRSGLAG